MKKKSFGKRNLLISGGIAATMLLSSGLGRGVSAADFQENLYIDSSAKDSLSEQGFNSAQINKILHSAPSKGSKADRLDEEV